MNKTSRICNQLISLIQIVFLLIISPRIFGQPGSLDLDFSADGKLIQQYSTSNDVAYDVAIQPQDQKIVIGGFVYQGSQNHNFLIARYNSDGSLDPSFDSDGFVTTDINVNSDDFIFSIVILENGKIMAAGYEEKSSIKKIVLARYNSNGTLDLSFNGNGYIQQQINNKCEPRKLLVQPDGKFVIAGFALDNLNNADYLVLRFNPDGTLDQTFNSIGYNIIPFGAGEDIALSAAIQPDERILVTGRSYFGGGSDLSCCRLLTNGTLDPSFGTAGKAVFSFGTNGFDQGNSIQTGFDNKIWIGGIATNGSFQRDFLLARLNENGTLDNNFNSQGYVLADFQMGYDEARTMILQPNGKVLLSGNAENGGVADYGLVRFNYDGTLDTNFGVNGKVITAMSSLSDDVYAMALKADGSIVCSGFSIIGSYADVSLAVYNNDLSKDWIPVKQGLNLQCRALIEDHNHNLYATGDFTTADGLNVNYIAKWNGTSWSPLGSGLNGAGYALAIDNLNNLYVGGTFTLAGGVSANRIAKWNGSTWSALESGLNGTVREIFIHSNGSIFVGGDFTLAGGNSANRIAVWNNMTWSTLGTGLNNVCKAITVDSQNNIFAGGDFTTAGGNSVNYIARWNGLSWSALGAGLNNPPNDFIIDEQGNLLVSGYHQSGNIYHIRKWDGSLWSDVGTGFNDAGISLSYGQLDNLFHAGQFTELEGGIPVSRVARWKGLNWTPFGSGLDHICNSVCTDSTGRIYIGGLFQTAGGTSCNRIAQYYDPCLVSYDEPLPGCYFQKGTSNYDSTCSPISFTTRFATASFYSTGSLNSYCDLEGADDDIWIKFMAQSNNTLIEINSNLPFGYQIIRNPSQINFSQEMADDNVVGCSESTKRTFQLTKDSSYYLRIYSLGLDTFINFDLCIRDVFDHVRLCSSSDKIADSTKITLVQGLHYENGLGSPAVYYSEDQSFRLGGANLNCFGDTWINPSMHYFKSADAGTLVFRIQSSTWADSLLPLVIYGPYDSYPGDYLGYCNTQACDFDSSLICLSTNRVNDTISLGVLQNKYYIILFLNPSNLIGDVYFDIISNSAVNVDNSPISCFGFEVETCNDTTNLYSIAATIVLNDLKPVSGYVLIKDDRGSSKTFYAPFPERMDVLLGNIKSDGETHNLSIILSEDLNSRFDTSYTAPSACNANPIAYYNPYFNYNSTAESGYTSGTMSISEQGSMLYQIPIQLPPGTAGVQPKLSISYNSNGGDGIMGYGFACDAMSFISRTGNTFDMDGWNLGVQLNEYDKLSINGERLIQTNAASTNGYLKSGAIYNTRNQSFTKYEAVGNQGEEPDYFIAYTKSGEKMYFGNSTDSKVVGITGVTSFWLLKRVEDQYGNYFEYEYFNRVPNLSIPANEFYPTRIRYTGNSLLTPYCKVDFTYTNRTNPVKPIENYNGGSLQIITKKLAQISVSYLDTIIKQYFISYDSSAISKILRVRTIKECGMNGKCFEPTFFDWDENEMFSSFDSIHRIPNLIPRGKISDSKTIVNQEDFNGDGLTDIVAYNLEKDSIYVFLNRDGLFETFLANRIHLLFQGVSENDVTNGSDTSRASLLISDLDGDNDPDFLFIHHPSGLNRITYNHVDVDRMGFATFPDTSFTNPAYIDNVGSEPVLMELVDLDGNGLPEIFAHVKSTGSNYFFTRVVDSTNIFYQKSESLLIPIPPNKDIRFLDLNNDASAEILWTDYVPGQLKIVINQILAPLPHFFTPLDSLKSKYRTSQYLISGTFSPPPTIWQIYFSEFNGDGLPDVAYELSQQIKFAINDGMLNFINRGTVNLPTGRQPVFSDYNRDSRFDLILYDVQEGNNTWYINNDFNGLSGNIQFTEQYTNLIHPNSIKVSIPKILPFKYQTYSDVIFINEVPTDTAKGKNFWWINQFKPSFKLNQVTNGLGQRNQIIYSSTNDTTVYKPYISDIGLLQQSNNYIVENNVIYELPKIKPFEYTGRMPVVKEFRIDDGFNGTNRVTYRYQKSRMDRSGAGFRGFNRVIIKDEASKLITVKKDTLTEFGIMSEFENYTMYEGDTYPVNRTFSTDDIIPTEFSITYTYFDSIQVQHTYVSYFQYNQSTSKLNYDLDGTYASTINSFNQVDSFGNVVWNFVSYNDGFSDTIYNTYSNNTSNWHLGRLTRSELHRHAPDTTPIVRVCEFEYNPLTGALIKEITEPDGPDSFRMEKTYTHDVFGNVLTERIGFYENGHWKTRGNIKSYDVRGRFIIQTSNDLGHTAYMAYNNLFGHKKSVTDINGLTSKMYFDDFGRLKRSEGADASWNEIAYYRCTNGCPSEAVTYTMKTDALGRTSKSYFDKMGREVRSEETGFRGHKIITENRFNTQGYLIGTTDPYYIGETPRWSIIAYDKLGREIIREETGGRVTSKVYYGLGLKITNPLGQVKTSYTYANGLVKQHIDNQGNILEYRYDAQGNIAKTVLPTGDAIISQFNILNQQVSLDDPDLGVYQYRYNGIGEIKYQIDPKGNEIFFRYDTLGRLVERKELEDVSVFTYDGLHGKGLLSSRGNKASLQSPDFITHFSYQYDLLSRPILVTYQAQGDSLVYELETEYDSLSRVRQLIYPTINQEETQIEYGYDTLGFNIFIKDAITNILYWHLDSITSQGKINRYTLGNGDKVERTYDVNFDWIKEIKTLDATDSVIQHLTYDHDIIGNLLQRTDARQSMVEHFQYDNLNRLTKAHVDGLDPIEMQYDVLGNITYKSDLGTYHYNQNDEGPHVLSSIDLLPGKCIPTAQTSFTYNSFNKITNIQSTHYAMDIHYSVDKQRYRQEYYFNAQWLKQKDYILDLVEREKTTSGEKTIIYIKGFEGAVAVKYHLSGNDSTYVHYWLKDHLGSLQTVVDAQDSIIEILSFDAWGQRRYPDGQPMLVGVPDFFSNERGFTGHEHLELFDLINMNGRMYDPILGRFITPDPFVSMPDDIQSYNRFSYVLNNPLAFTDPSGYGFFKSFVAPFKKAVKRAVSAVSNIAQGNISQGLKDLGQATIYWTRGAFGWDVANERGAKIFGKENWNTIVVTAATIAVATAMTAVTGCPVAAGAASGFVGGALGTILSGGDIHDALKAGLKGAAIGAVSAGLTNGVGEMAETMGYARGIPNSGNFGAFGVKVAGHGIVQGALSEYQGGSFKSGFASGAFTAFASPMTGQAKTLEYRVMISAVTGGTASELSGGKFSNGAISGAMVQLMNCEKRLQNCKTSEDTPSSEINLVMDIFGKAADHGVKIDPTSNGWKATQGTLRGLGLLSTAYDAYGVGKSLYNAYSGQESWQQGVCSGVGLVTSFSGGFCGPAAPLCGYAIGKLSEAGCNAAFDYYNEKK